MFACWTCFNFSRLTRNAVQHLRVAKKKTVGKILH